MFTISFHYYVVFIGPTCLALLSSHSDLVRLMGDQIALDNQRCIFKLLCSANATNANSKRDLLKIAVCICM